MKKRIYLSSPTMTGKEMPFVQEAFDTNWIAPLGENVNNFEKELASFVGTSHAAALASGTSALHLALKLCGVGAGDLVFCSDLTFIATCNPIAYEKAIPVFIDSEKETWNMCPEALKRAFAKYPKPKAVVLAHLYGTPAKMEELMAICEEYEVPLIEDAAESLGAKYEERFTGTFGKFGIFSFNGNKIITTSGGGMLVSDEEESIQKARFLATQAREPARHYEHKEIGYNYRMSNVVAGIGRGQLQALDYFIEKKEWIYNFYKERLSGYKEVMMNPYLGISKPNFWLSCMTFKEDCEVTPLVMMDALDAENIESRPIWKPMHLQPVFQGCDFITGKGTEDSSGAAVSEDIYKRGICLPSDVKNTEQDMDAILNVMIATMTKAGYTKR